MYKNKIIILTIFLFMLFLSCNKEHEPIISSISGPSSVLVNGSATFDCIATDADGDPLTYSWTCTSGSFNSSTGSSVTWNAPSSHGSSTITVDVSDGRGGEDSKSKSITVQQVTTTLINWSGTIPTRTYHYWTEYINSGYQISGYFTATNTTIDFLVLDASNYSNWVNGQSYNYIVQNLGSSGNSFSATITASGTYYFIIWNANFLYSKVCDLFVQSTSP